MTSLTQKRANIHLNRINGNTQLLDPIQYHTGQVKISSAGGIGVYADSSPAPVADADGRDGWLFNKTIADASKFNYYFYGQGNTPILLNEISALLCDVTIDNYQGISSLPFIIIYTKPTGVGDAGAWYHSRVTYTMNSDEVILLGEAVTFYGGLKPTHQSNIHERRLIECNTVLTSGDALGSEEILTIALHSDSGSPASTKILVSSLGLDVIPTGGKKIETRLKLIN
tara:strand:- start:401 stop:1081 length:681 start_codon:yes stop_codon:yes gene_type:complete